MKKISQHPSWSEIGLVGAVLLVLTALHFTTAPDRPLLHDLYPRAGAADAAFEVLLFNAIAWLTGALVEADRRQRERAFDPFYTTKEGGTGLGLAVVQRIMDGLGGGVKIKSEPGKGTTVILELPA